jgi:hypothetical protein
MAVSNIKLTSFCNENSKSTHSITVGNFVMTYIMLGRRYVSLGCDAGK